WLLVLLKLITPSFIACPVPWLDELQRAAPQSIARGGSLPLGEGLMRSDHDAEAEHLLPSVPDVSPAPFEASRDAELTVQPEDAQPLAAGADGATSALPTTSGSVRSWVPALAGLWLAGSITWFAFVAQRIYRFRRLLRCARPASPELVAQAQRLADRLGL